jgi:acyl-CoA synthetase (AMP-forming)/AMP-acid ligase II
MNIAMLLEMSAEAMGDRAALGPSANALTYEDVLGRVRRLAAVIAESGAERVGFVDQNSVLLPQLLFASGVAGVPFAPLNYRLSDEQLRGVAARLAPALVVANDSEAGRLIGIEGVTVIDHSELEQRLAAAGEPPATADTDEDDAVAVWLFTSGTTGEPKAALLRHRHLSSYVLTTVEFMGSEEDQAALVSVPPYHIAAMAAILSSLYSGRRIVYLPQFDADEWVRLVDAEGITHAMVVPTMLGRVLDAVERAGTTLPTLGHLSYGGGRMPLPVIERAMRLLPNVGFVNAYGLTETSSTVAVLGPDDHREAFGSDDPKVRARLASVGQPLPTLELEIRDPMGEPVAQGETGEIYVRGEQVAGEYLGRSALTDDGWFPTRDGGRLDEGGYLFVEGRIDDVIVRGGENMSPGEIEDVLVQHPAVADAGVTGVPDDEWGEAVAAVVVFHPGKSATEAELQDWVRQRLRSSRTPVIIEVRESLPYNPTGKLLRRELKEELAAAAKGR